MARLFTARDIVGLALRKCGVVPQQDQAPSENQTQIGLQFLDLVLSETSSVERIWSLVPQNATFTYTADADSVDVTALLGQTNQLDVFRRAYKDATDDEIMLLRRDEWDMYQNTGVFPFTTGSVLYIQTDGDDTYTAYLRPVPTTALLIRLVGQKFSTTVTQASNSQSNLAHGFERAFQRWMVRTLSVELGDGPIARLPEERLDRWRGEAADSWARLTSSRGGGQRKKMRATRAWTG